MLPQITSTAHAKSLSRRCRISNPPGAGVHVARSASPGDGSNPGYARGVGRPHVWQVVGTAGSGATVAALAANGGVLGRYSDHPASPHLSPVRSKPRSCSRRFVTFARAPEPLAVGVRNSVSSLPAPVASEKDDVQVDPVILPECGNSGTVEPVRHPKRKERQQIGIEPRRPIWKSERRHGNMTRFTLACL
jgi:hypothetical protein